MLFRFRFEGFATIFFILARIVFRATRALDAGLFLPARLRTLDEEAGLARFETVFALEAGLVFFVFDLVVFFDLLRAVIVKLSTRERVAHTLKTRAPAPLSNGERALRPRNHALSEDLSGLPLRLICRLAQNRREIKEEDEPEPPTTVAHG